MRPVWKPDSARITGIRKLCLWISTEKRAYRHKLRNRRQWGSYPQTGFLKSFRRFPRMLDTFCLFQCSPARNLPANAGTLDY